VEQSAGPFLLEKTLRQDESHNFWAVPTGAGIVALVLLSVVLIAAGGWDWFAGFLTSSASGWAQAIGTVIAVVATAHIARSDQRRRDEQTAVVAEFTASNLTGILEPFVLEMAAFADRFGVIARIDCDPNDFDYLLEKFKPTAIEFTEQQMERLSPVPKPITHDLIDAIIAHRSIVRLMEYTCADNRLRRDSTQRKDRAQEISRFLWKTHELAAAARAALMEYMESRGVTMHNLQGRVVRFEI
jgi:hypothetical protein